MQEIVHPTESKQKIHILWDVIPCQQVNTSWCCGGVYCFHLQNSLRRIISKKNGIVLMNGVEQIALWPVLSWYSSGYIYSLLSWLSSQL